MTESSKFLSLQQLLTTHPAIKSFLKTTSTVAEKYSGLGKTAFLSKADLSELGEQLNELNIAEMSEVLGSLCPPQTIVAFPIRCAQHFTLFLVLVPKGGKFDWHSHPSMAGISRCFHGQIRISAIERALLRPKGEDFLSYPRDKIRVQMLNASDKETISLVEHDAYNIHKIEALQFSAFFDLLVPDYPDDTCQFYKEEEEDGEELVVREMSQGEEEVVGWDVYHQQLLTRESRLKSRIKTYILQ